LQSSLNLSDDHLDRDRVVPAARHDDVRVAFARLDELEVHRLHGRQILFDYLVQRTAAVVGVALDAANESNVGVGIDENLDVAQLANSLVDEEQNSIDYHHVGRLYSRRAWAPEVSHEIVSRLVDRFAFAQRFQMRA